MRRPTRQALLFGLTMLALILIIAGGFKWRTDQTNKAAAESRRADYAQCLAINSQRKDDRLLATANYNVLADRIRFDPPASIRLRRAWRRSLELYAKVLKAQRPLNCLTYARPNLPPDSGVR